MMTDFSETEIGSALERFAFASWREMVTKEGNVDKVYSPYSAFVALLMSAILCRGETKEELLRALQFTSNNTPEILAQQLADLILHSEYAPQFYDAEFDRFLGENGSSLTPVQKCYLYATAIRQYGSVANIPHACQQYQYMVDRLLSKPFAIAGANNLWPNENRNIDMNQFALLTETLHASVSPVTFPEPGVSQINKFIEDVTAGLIKDLIPAGTASTDTACILTNAIYFNGRWRTAFKDNCLIPTAWTNVKGDEYNVALMNQRSNNRYLETENGQFVSIDYENCDYSMIIGLPKETGREAMNAFVESITPELLKQVSCSDSVYLDLSVPKFKSKWGTESLREMLNDLGAQKIFTGAAEFIVCDGAPCCVSDVLQQAFIKVEEQGTEAAAATAVVMRCMCCMRPKPVLFKCNHSFMYFIRNNRNGAILFMGLCDDPKFE